MSTDDPRFDALEVQLGDALLLAEAGQFEQAIALLEAHDTAVRRHAAVADAAIVDRLAALLAAQRRVLDRLLLLRDGAACALRQVARQRRSLAAYDAIR